MKFFKGREIKQIACGGLHTIVVADDGDLYSWGSTEGGQLGIETKDDEAAITTPQLVKHLKQA